MVKPSSRAGQRRSAISLRTICGRLGSISVVSATRPATPAVAAMRINFRLVVGRKGKRFSGVTQVATVDVIVFQHNPNPRFVAGREHDANQKLNVACNSIRRLAAVPGENGPP